MPVLVSPELVIDGVDAEPSANSIVCAPLVVTIVPLVVGRVSVVVPDTAGAAKVTVPDVSPATTMLAMFYPYAVYVPDELNLIIVLEPEVVIVGEPVVVPV
jgi:hypothetical protein